MGEQTTVKLQVTSHDVELSPADQELIERYRARLAPRLRHFDPDLVHLALSIWQQARTGDYLATVRLTLLNNHTLPARRNSGPSIAVVLKRAFEDIEEQLGRFKSKLRREYTYERKRTSLAHDAVQAHERELLEERELLDRALTGDRAAFDTLAEAELPGLSQAIAEGLREQGREDTPEAIEQVIADVLTAAFAELARKPTRWSLGGWLVWLARRQIRHTARGPAVAQAAPVTDHSTVP